MDISHIALSRHTCKGYDPDRQIPAELIEQLKILLRFSPSSVNSQPWHFIIASSPEAKARVARAASEGAYISNGPKILNASHVIVFCARTTLDDAHVASLLEQEVVDGRLPTEEARAAQSKGRNYYIHHHRFDRKDMQCWMEKQVYLALGTLLFGAAALEIDATPIEGFDPVRLDLELDLYARGMTSVVLAALGYRGDDDFNVRLPKSRLPEDAVITEI
ncbi:oxygen-insensitive NAD(P)H nitroreductase [Mariprofundus erugo]|uniref:oxygen-insensitive NAD(P)H nitroreductase n=1 Tax=Mariprofundus erugo TaxID=2528639 RepID=UPI0010FECA3A|nr:oxygen-insensitive NAD(P)H nitroreductase [Mariprofundus erugo]TLS76699.1 oxygen-insensitive NAD(P)H nitroreductase [Mariprofundus erugo]